MLKKGTISYRFEKMYVHRHLHEHIETPPSLPHVLSQSHQRQSIWHFLFHLSTYCRINEIYKHPHGPEFEYKKTQLMNDPHQNHLQTQRDKCIQKEYFL